MLGSLEASSAQYIAGYVVKKMNSPNSMLLPGQKPEFARMSRRHGIGVDAMWDVASALLQLPSTRVADVPLSLRHGIRSLPLGPYLRRILRQRIGRDEHAPAWALEQARAQVSMVFDYARHNAPPGVRRAVVKALIGEFNDQLNRNIAARNVRKETVE
jgi:hypothetical protein